MSSNKLLTNNPLLGTLFFLQRLLDFRKHIRLGERAAGAQTVVVTWIDIVLAKLGLLATPLAVNLAAYDPENEPEWIRLRREDDNIRAATQLPGINHTLSSDSCRKSSSDSWNSIVAVIGSSDFSPAARRLATSLNFIAYTMVGQLTSDKAWPREGYELNFLFSLFKS